MSEFLVLTGMACYVVAGIWWSEFQRITLDQRVARRLVWAVVVPVILCNLP